mgnify:FL=1
MTPAEQEELAALRRYDELCSLGDRPMSPAVAKLRRLMELEAAERDDVQRRQEGRLADA